MRFSSTALLAITVFALSAHADKVYVGGKPIIGKVVKDTVEKVVLKVGNTETEFRQEDVTKIEYEPTPPEFHRAENLRKQGHHEEAAESYRTCLEVACHPQLKQYILYGLGASLLNLGEDKEAQKVFGTLLKKYPDTRFLVEAAEGVVQLQLKAGVKGGNEMERYIKIVEIKAPRRAALIRARIAEQLNDESRALKWFRKVTDESDREEQIHWEARVGIARIAIKRRDYATFQDQFQEAISNPETVPPHIMAEFYLNAAREAKQKARTDPQLLDQALEFYVRVFALYDTKASHSMSAEAAFQAAALAELISTKGDHPELKAEAQRLFKYVVSQYSGTRWAKDARSRIK